MLYGDTMLLGAVSCYSFLLSCRPPVYGDHIHHQRSLKMSPLCEAYCRQCIKSSLAFGNIKGLPLAATAYKKFWTGL